MRLFNRSNATRSAKKVNTDMILNHVDLALDHVLDVLRHSVRSQEKITRGDLRGSMTLFSTQVENDDKAVKARKGMWGSVGKDTDHASYAQVMMCGWPLFTFGDDRQELELSDSEGSFEDLNGLLISIADGPMVVSFELGTSTGDDRDDLGCSAAATVFWDQDPSTPILSKTLDAVTSILDLRLTPGSNTQSFHEVTDLVKEVMAAVSVEDDTGGELTLVDLDVSLCHTVRSLTPIDDDPEVDPVYDGRLTMGDMVGIAFRATATLSDAKCYTIGFERVIRVEPKPLFYYPAFIVVNKLRTESLSSWISTSMMLDLSTTNKSARKRWGTWNVHYDPSVKSTSKLYNGSPGLAREFRDRAGEADEAIRKVFEKGLGLDRITTAALVIHSEKNDSAVCPDFSFLMFDTLGRLFPRHQLGPVLRRSLTNETKRYKYSDHAIAAWKKKSLTGFSRRFGKWDETVDGPALQEVMFRFCNLFKVSPAEVCDMIFCGLSAVAPLSLLDGSAPIVRRLHQEPKSIMFASLFGILSLRMTIWDYRDLSAKPLYQIADEVRRTMKPKLDRYQPPRKFEKIRVSVYKHRMRIRAVLNEAARSGKAPFASLNLAQDDWAGWDAQFSRVKAGVHNPVHIAIHAALIKAFADAPVIDMGKSTKMIHFFLDKTISEQSLKSLGRNNSAGKRLSRADICAYAALLYLLRVDFENPRFYETKLPPGYFDVIRLCLPHLRSSIFSIQKEHRHTIGDAYRAISDLGEEERSLAFATLFSEADAEVITRFRERIDNQ